MASKGFIPIFFFILYLGAATSSGDQAPRLNNNAVKSMAAPITQRTLLDFEDMEVNVTEGEVHNFWVYKNFDWSSSATVGYLPKLNEWYPCDNGFRHGTVGQKFVTGYNYVLYMYNPTPFAAISARITPAWYATAAVLNGIFNGTKVVSILLENLNYTSPLDYQFPPAFSNINQLEFALWDSPATINPYPPTCGSGYQIVVDNIVVDSAAATPATREGFGRFNPHCVVCTEGMPCTISCDNQPDSWAIDRIMFAGWGNPDTNCSNNPVGSGTCHSRNPAFPVDKHCKGQHSCNIDLSDSFLGGDRKGACAGITKTLRVQYNCAISRT